MAQPADDAVCEAVQGLVDRQIRLLAIDFDQTFVDCHTGGHWGRGTQALIDRVRPFFPVLVTEAIRNHINVAICTFSPQTSLIREVMDTVLADDDARTIIIRGNDHTWDIPRGSHGKQAHLQSAADAFGGGLEFTEMCLIDDDNRNIMYAKNEGVLSIYCPARSSSAQAADAVLGAMTASDTLKECVRHTSSSNKLAIQTTPDKNSSDGPLGRSPQIITRPFSPSVQSEMSSPPASPHSPYGSMQSPYGPFGTHSPYGSPRHSASPMGMGGGMGSPHSPYGRSPMGGMGMMGRGGFF